MKKFSKMVLAELGKELNEQEMKGITGGYGTYGGYSGGSSGGGYDGYSGTFYCIHGYSGGVRPTDCFMSFNSAVAFCDFYATLGHVCRCFPC